MKRVIFTFAFIGIFMMSAMAQLTPINWASWADEPQHVDHDATEGYKDIAYDKLEYMAQKAHPDWNFASDAVDFDAVWNSLGDSACIANHVNGTEDPFDIASGTGAAFKATWDDDNIYVLLKFWDGDDALDNSGFEVAVQPVYQDRYEPDFQAATTIEEENAAYCRYNELGGSKTKWVEAAVPGESVGTNGQGGGWGANPKSSVQMALNDHMYAAGTGVDYYLFVFDFAESLSYMVDPMGTDEDANRATIDPASTEGLDTLAFDVQAFGEDGLPDGDPDVEKYFWSSVVNDGYTSLYYNGYLLLWDQVVGIKDVAAQESNIKVFAYENELRLKNIDNVNLKVYNVAGSLVKSAENVSESLNISDLSAGMYIVKLDGVAKSFKIVKQH